MNSCTSILHRRFSCHSSAAKRPPRRSRVKYVNSEGHSLILGSNNHYKKTDHSQFLHPVPKPGKIAGGTQWGSGWTLHFGGSSLSPRFPRFLGLAPGTPKRRETAFAPPLRFSVTATRASALPGVRTQCCFPVEHIPSFCLSCFPPAAVEFSLLGTAIYLSSSRLRHFGRRRRSTCIVLVFVVTEHEIEICYRRTIALFWTHR